MRGSVQERARSYRNTAGKEFDKISSVEDRGGVIGLARLLMDMLPLLDPEYIPFELS